MKSVCDYDKPNNEYVLDREVKIANGIFFHIDSKLSERNWSNVQNLNYKLFWNTHFSPEHGILG